MENSNSEDKYGSTNNRESPLDYSNDDDDKPKGVHLPKLPDDITIEKVSIHGDLPMLLQNLYQRPWLQKESLGLNPSSQVAAAIIMAQKESNNQDLINPRLSFGVNPPTPSLHCPSLLNVTQLQKVNQESLAEYSKFRENMLRKFSSTKLGARQESLTNGTTSPCSDYNSNDECKDKPGDAYWERRKKNNEAAKRSRDARRAKEDEVAIRAAFLEQENLQLKFEVAKLKSETDELRKALLSMSPDSGFESA